MDSLLRMLTNKVGERWIVNRMWGKRVWIHGVAGIGKTELARKLVKEYGSGPGGIFELLPGDLEDPDIQSELRAWLAGQREIASTPLLVIDDYDGRRIEEVVRLNGLLEGSKWLPAICIARRKDFGIGINFGSPVHSEFGVLEQTHSLEIGPLDSWDSCKLLRMIASGKGVILSEADIERTAAGIGGHPLALSLVGSLLAAGTEAEILLQRLHDFHVSGVLVAPDRILRPYEIIPQNIALDIVSANADLLERLQKNPELLHILSPRQFEDVVAKILDRLGYSVRLTPATRDGGKDIYVATRSDLGSFLYLVECKHFAPDRPVGVGIVRELYGTLSVERATAAMLVTTSYFTKKAKEFTESIRYQMSLRDYVGLQEWLDKALRKME